ncbi:hypothetical protein AXG93_3217s1200 [Marchantia polymorpha subsp. ruderalis]|uniref:Ribonuclease H1 N-terminal domain-containing protein n=1 Tax=Marchantia polymorpha subsp. ruderalis TaxID=1480154 RepID=A0A176VWB9_MARPO|nr:hypothetical protein AXG93_3217s1200 [Marchantia polymorpha subsp. ruderalis]
MEETLWATFFKFLKSLLCFLFTVTEFGFQSIKPRDPEKGAVTSEASSSSATAAGSSSAPVRKVPNPVALDEDFILSRKYYVVAIGRRPGVYFGWREAAAQVLGFPAEHS